jgi:chitinase
VADNFGNNGNLYGNFNQLKKLKALHPNLKILISLGGWSLSTYFSDVAATPESRAKFVSACIDTFIKGNLPTGGWPEDAGGIGAAAGIFDGIDVDWEYPGIDPGNGAHHSPADKANATLLFKEFRKQLDAIGAANGKHYILTAALPAADVHSSGSYDLAAVGKVLDYAFVMTYDFHGASDAYTAFNSPFLLDKADPAATDKYWSTVGTIEWYLKKGFPLNKIVLGVPFYGKQYIGVGTAKNGLYQAFDNTGMDINSLVWDQQPTPTYHQLVDQAGIVGANGAGQNGYKTFWDLKAGEPWLWNPAGVHVLNSGTITTPTFISYENPTTILERNLLVRTLGLRGLFAWEISQDSDALALTTAMGNHLLGH